jgi:hypothetical protein
MKENKSEKVCNLKLKVVRLYDEFSQFSEQCAFLCDSFAAIPAQQGFIEPQTIAGIHFYSYWLKSRVLEIRSELWSIHEQLSKFK